MGPEGRFSQDLSQDIDLAVASNNTLIVVECKSILKNQTAAIFKVAELARRIGGLMCRSVYVREQPAKGGVDHLHGNRPQGTDAGGGGDSLGPGQTRNEPRRVGCGGRYGRRLLIRSVGRGTTQHR